VEDREVSWKRMETVLCGGSASLKRTRRTFGVRLKCNLVSWTPAGETDYGKACVNSSRGDGWLDNTRTEGFLVLCCALSRLRIAAAILDVQPPLCLAPTTTFRRYSSWNLLVLPIWLCQPSDGENEYKYMVISRCRYDLLSSSNQHNHQHN
jgi:hypothetical protein